MSRPQPLAPCPAAGAAAADATVTSLSELQAALSDCSTAPNTITLGADIEDPSITLSVTCDTTIDLQTYDLTVLSVQIAPMMRLEIDGPTDDSGGTLTADASGSNFTPGVQTTNATFAVHGGHVDARGGINASAIGGSLAGSGGVFELTGGEVEATAYPTAYGTAIGGGYISGNGGVVNVSGGTLYAVNAATYGTAIGGGSAGANGDGGAGATISVTGGAVYAYASGAKSTGIGGGGSGLDASNRGGAGGSLFIGQDGLVAIESPRTAFGVGYAELGSVQTGDFGSLVVEGTLRLPSGALYLNTAGLPSDKMTVSPTGRVLGQDADPAQGASISGVLQIQNQGAVALEPDSPIRILGNNRLLTFDSGAPSVRVYAPSPAEGYRELPAAPVGTAWNTAADGSGGWFSNVSSTVGAGTTPLYSVVPATIEVSEDQADLTAVAGEAYDYPVTVFGPNDAPLAPQPSLNYSSSDCTVPSDGVYQLAGPCTITVTTTVEGVELSETFTIEVVAGSPATLTLNPATATVDQGDTLTFTATAADEFGNPVDTSSVVLTSSVASDVVSGLSVTFPTASTHVITATLGEATTTAEIEVTPAPAPKPDSKPDVKPGLSVTGAEPGGFAFIAAAGIALVILGGVVLVARRASVSR